MHLSADAGEMTPSLPPLSLSHAVGCCCAGFAVVVAARRYGPNLMGNGGFNKAEESSDLRLRRLGIITAITLTCHNLPEGMAVALSTMGSTHLGLRMAFAIALHNIPEGLAIAGPLMMSRKTSRLSAIGLALASGLSEPVGALMTLIFFKHFITEVCFPKAQTGPHSLDSSQAAITAFYPWQSRGSGQPLTHCN